MGETSAKRLRGGEMDDVIFGGTGTRPARNVAEVGLHLDNAGRTAPTLYNEHSEIEVVRRIERGAGSAYRINGREVRARDVQLLFADLATGAHSTAMVSQGRIGWIIGAKPIERRALLEEAAGISGLHARRHEAELRLKAAEANLTRLEDIIRTQEEQLEALKKQARQAGRYRRLSDHIRRAEAMVLHLRWLRANAELEAAVERLHAVEGQSASSPCPRSQPSAPGSRRRASCRARGRARPRRRRSCRAPPSRARRSETRSAASRRRAPSPRGASTRSHRTAPARRPLRPTLTRPSRRWKPSAETSQRRKGARPASRPPRPTPCASPAVRSQGSTPRSRP